VVLCPVAIAVGCKKCPVFKLCPAKSIIGDYAEKEKDQSAPRKTGAAPAAREKK